MGATKISTKISTKSGGASDGGAKGPVFSGPGKFTMHGGHAGATGGSYRVTFRYAAGRGGKVRYASRSYGYADDGYDGSLQCVPFARAASGIDLKGNAGEWWSAAAGVYERGERPEPGSVLNFRPTGHMRLGHVAVVAAVVNSREIEIDHANWAGAGAYKGGVARGVHVIDASPGNDWSAVKVALGNGDYGSTYPTYGFIYDRPDTGTGTGTMFAKTDRAIEATESEPTEVAEAPAPREIHVHGSGSHQMHPIVKHISFSNAKWK